MADSGAELRNVRWKTNPILMAAAALGLSIIAFAPSLIALVHPNFFDYRWHRAYAFMEQAANPFRSDVELVMRWRLLPAFIAHYLGLRGYWTFAVPWLGVLSFIIYVAYAFRRFPPTLVSFSARRSQSPRRQQS